MTTAWALAPGVLRLREHRWAGGAPYRVVRLAPAADRALVALLGQSGPAPADLRPLTERLVRYGLLVPPASDATAAVDDVTVVVPALSAPRPVRRLLAAVPPGVPVVVVDDGSSPPLHSALTDLPDVTVLRHAVPRGPAAARNAGAAVARTAWIVFVDADVEPPPGWLAALRAAADDDEVVAVGPRVRSTAAPGPGGFVERHAGGLDLGPTPATVAAGGPVGYLPSAVLLVRRDVFTRVGGFDAAMHVAEDVDLVWRLLDEGSVRYAPHVTVWHAARPSLAAVLRRRAFYGTGAADLDARHPGAVRHADVSVFSLVPWLLGVLVHPALGLAGAAVTVAAAPRSLPTLPRTDAWRLALHGQEQAALALGRFAVRPWWPVTAAALLVVPRRRRVLLTVLGTAVLDLVRRARRDPAVPPGALPAVVVARLLDDLAYAVGVWRGTLRHRRLRPLLPRVRGRARA